MLGKTCLKMHGLVLCLLGVSLFGLAEAAPASSMPEIVWDGTPEATRVYWGAQAPFAVPEAYFFEVPSSRDPFLVPLLLALPSMQPASAEKKDACKKQNITLCGKNRVLVSFSDWFIDTSVFSFLARNQGSHSRTAYLLGRYASSNESAHSLLKPDLMRYGRGKNVYGLASYKLAPSSKRMDLHPTSPPLIFVRHGKNGGVATAISCFKQNTPVRLLQNICLHSFKLGSDVIHLDYDRQYLAGWQTIQHKITHILKTFQANALKNKRISQKYNSIIQPVWSNQETENKIRFNKDFLIPEQYFLDDNRSPADLETLFFYLPDFKALSKKRKTCWTPLVKQRTSSIACADQVLKVSIEGGAGQDDLTKYKQKIWSDSSIAPAIDSPIYGLYAYHVKYTQNSSLPDVQGQDVFVSYNSVDQPQAVIECPANLEKEVAYIKTGATPQCTHRFVAFNTRWVLVYEREHLPKWESIQQGIGLFFAHFKVPAKAH